MLRKVFFVLLCFSAAACFACSTAETPNANSANSANRIDSTNIPPEFQTSPIPMNANIPGIPNPNDANANKIPTGNIPGIPDPNKAKTPQPKNTPPIPGIPSEAEIKRQMNTPLKDVNIVNNPQKGQTDERPANKRANRQP